MVSGGLRELGLVDVVEAGDGDVARDPHATRRERVHRAARHLVVGRDERVELEPEAEPVADQLACALELEVTVADELVLQREPALVERVTEGLLARERFVVPGRATDVREAAAPVHVVEMIHGAPHRAVVVGLNERRVAPGVADRDLGHVR